MTDNPVWADAVDEDHPFGRFISTGGYHNPHAVLAMDALTAACANLCVLAGRQGAKLLDGAVSLLPDQLTTAEPGGEGRRAHMGGLPMAQTGYEEEARLYAQATLLPGSESGGFGPERRCEPGVPRVVEAGPRRAMPRHGARQSRADRLARFRCHRPARPSAIGGLEAAVRELEPDLARPAALGPLAASIAGVLRRDIYPS